MPAKPKRRSGWNPERKAKQRKAIYRWRPWEKSSGPKSREGKRRASQNAVKHGLRSRAHQDEIRLWRNLLAELG